MNDRQAAELVKEMLGALNGRIAQLEEENAQLKNDLAKMTTRMQKFDDAKIDYSDRLIKVLIL